MEVGENRVRVFYGTEKREGERPETYGRDVSPCCSHRVSDLQHISRTRIPVTYTFPNNHTEFESFIFLYVWLHSLHARSRSLRLVTVILETSPENLIAIRYKAQQPMQPGSKMQTERELCSN
jgi:hypothetical protein